MQHGRKKQLAKALRQESNDAPPKDPGIASGRVAGFIGAARDALLEKYEHLSRKYEALVKKYETASAEQTGVYRLGWWALRTSASALALVGHSGIILSNSRWHELDHGGGERGWDLLVVDQPQRRFASLHHLAMEAAANLFSSKDATSAVERYRHAGGQQVIEVRTERIAEDHLVAVLEQALVADPALRLHGLRRRLA